MKKLVFLLLIASTAFGQYQRQINFQTKATTRDSIAAYIARTTAGIKTALSLNSVENTALSTWAGTSNLTTGGAFTATKLVASDSARVEKTSLLKGTVTTNADIVVGTKAVVNDSLRVEETALIKGALTANTKAVVNDSLRVEETSLFKGVVTMNSNLIVGGRIEQQSPDHCFIAFEDSSVALSMGVKDTWYQVTNATDSLFGNFEIGDGFTWDADTLTYTGTNNPHIRFEIHLTGHGGANEDYEIQIFNVTDNAGVPVKGEVSTTGANNRVSVGFTCYDINANTNDEYIMRIRNRTNGNAFTVENGSILANVLHY